MRISREDKLQWRSVAVSTLNLQLCLGKMQCEHATVYQCSRTLVCVATGCNIIPGIEELDLIQGGGAITLTSKDMIPPCKR